MAVDSISGADDGLGESPQFVHLRVHSAYSLLEGALPVKKIIARALADDQPAIGLTDTNNLFAALEFSKTASGEGIQPLIGCQLSIDMEDEVADERNGRQQQLRKLPSIVMIAATADGYRTLSSLVSRAYMEGEGHGTIHIKRSWLGEAVPDIIALTGARGGPVDAAMAEGHPDLAAARLSALASLFGDRLYVEL